LQATLEPRPGTVVRLCGPLVVEIAGERLDSAFPSRQGRLVFAYLVLNRGRPVSRDELIEALWPDRAPDSADVLLTGLLSRLRGALPSGMIEGRSQLSLRLPTDAWVDVEAAAVDAGRAQDALAREDPAGAASIARAALAIVERPLLPELDRDWVSERRRELDGIASALLDVVARAGLQARGAQLVAGEAAARRLIEREPLRESAYGLLMEILAERGDVAQALEVYDGLRTRLREEVGTVPGAVVRALGEQLLLHGELAPAPPRPEAGERSVGEARLSSPDRAASVLRVSGALVGRDTELAVLDRALRGADGGETRALGIVGEPGIGKSRLLAELGQRAAARGHLVLVGRASELERDVPFALWVDALDRHVGPDLLAGMQEEQLPDAAVALPAVGRIARVAPAVAVERHRIARAVRALLECLTAAQPVTLLFDDVQWADAASADVLALLLHRPPDGTALLGLAARAGRAPALETALETAARRRDAEIVELGPLSRAAADELMPGVGPVNRARLYGESGGNPFYLEELVRAGSPAAGGSASKSARAGRVPRAVKAALAGEIANLGGEARLTAQGGAVAGDPFDLGVAAAAGGVSEAAALAALDELCAADLVRRTEQPRRFRFRHPLVRRAVYESGGGGWRLAAHARAADELERRGATAAERAHHVERAAHAGDLDAVELLALAAEQTAQSAPATAAGWYGAASRLLPEGEEFGERRLGLLLAQAGALASAGRAVEARDVLRRVLAMLPADQVDWRVGVAVAVAELEALWIHEPVAARELLEAERAALGDVAPGAAAALTMAMAAERYEYGDFAAVRALAEEARAGARAAGDRPLEALAAVVSADASHCGLRGDDPHALTAVDAQIAEAGALIDALSEEQASQHLQMLITLTMARLFTGDFPGARIAVERGLLLARRTRQGLLTPAFVALRGFTEQELGRLDPAQADAEEALDIALLSGNVQATYWASIELSVIALQRGDSEAALEHGQTAWNLLGAREHSEAGYVVADAHLAAGDAPAALKAIEAFEWVRPQMWTLDRAKATDVAVRVLLALGRVDEAVTWAERAPIESGGRRSGIFGAIAARSRASCLLVSGEADEAARVAAAGATHADEASAPVWAGRCRTLAGEALAASGRPDAARQQLSQAVSELDELGAFGPRDTALRLLRGIRADGVRA
jgi:DNA-binding SARP family transcriptional activator/tetratricopeptide (TPR) repeat protein